MKIFKSANRFISITIFCLFISFSNFAYSDELKKINTDLKNIENLFNTGVLDEESYNSAKSRLDQKKAKLLAEKNNSKKDSNTNSKTLEKQIQVLEKLYKDGTLTKEEFLKTKKFLTDKENKGENIDLNELKSDPIPITNYILNIQTDAGNKNWEKAEIIFGNYRIYTHRPGGIKVIRISDQKQLVRVTDNYKIKYSNNGESVIRIDKTSYKPPDLAEAISGIEKEVNNKVKEITEILKNPFKKRKKAVFDTETHKLELYIEDSRILHYVGRYVRQHKAFFYQVLTDKAEPFHYYIRIDGKAAIALNMKFFNIKIDKAVRKVKKKLSLEYNISEEQIQKIIDERVGEETNKAIEREMESAINESVKEAIKETIGQELSSMLVRAVEQATGEAIDSAIEQELAEAIDQEIALAVEMGIDEAAVSAGWEAYFEVLAQGGTYEEANAAAYDACGSACDNY
jgi:uncharacterized protein YqgQ